MVYSRERRSIAATGGTSSSQRTTCRSMLWGRKVSTECSTGAPSAVHVTCSISSAAVVARHRQRPAERVAPGQHPRHDVRAVVGHGHALLEQDVEHHLTALQRAAQPRGRGQGDARMHDVAHVGAGDAIHDQDARDRRRRGLRIEPEEPALLGAQRAPLDLQVGELQPQAAPAGELVVGDELLQALVQRPRRGAPDERAAALAAHDLSALLQALQRRAQRAARDPQAGGQLLLGWKALARAVAPGGQPAAQGVLGDVDQRRPGLASGRPTGRGLLCHDGGMVGRGEALRTARRCARSRRCRR